MTGMNVWKRATLAIVRKPVRGGIIGLLMLMVFTSLVAQVGESRQPKGSEPVLTHPRRRENRLRT